MQAFDSNIIKEQIGQIVDYNESINYDFQKVKTSVNRMLEYWDCNAISSVVSQFDILNKKAQNRYKKQNEIIKLLKNITGGYEETEIANESSLSSQFK